MTTAAGTTIHVDRTEIRHGHVPGPDGYSSLSFGKPGQGAYASVFFYDTVALDVVIAELVALKQEMDPPVITDSERTCNEVNPDDTREHCTRGGDHGVHRDSNGDEWRTDAPSSVQQPAPVVRVTETAAGR